MSGFSTRRLICAALSGVGALLLIGGLAVVRNPQLSRCVLLSRMRLSEIEPGVFVDPAMNTEARSRLRTEIAVARGRVSRFIGPLQGTAAILAGDERIFRKYGSRGGADFSLTHTSAMGDYIVVGRSGANADCISHELMHVELHRRVGLLRYGRLPAWFDEGLAMYVDHRPEFSEREYQRVTEAGRNAPDLKSITSRRDFHRDSYRAYLTSKHVVSEWYRRAGYHRLVQLLDRVGAGEDFSTVYAELERQAQEESGPGESPFFVTAQKPARTL